MNKISSILVRHISDFLIQHWGLDGRKCSFTWTRVQKYKDQRTSLSKK